MEDLHTNSSISGHTDDFHNSSNEIEKNSIESFVNVMELIIVCIGLPLVLLVTVAVVCLARNDHVAPVYVINLLISDLLQLCCLAAWLPGQTQDIISDCYTFGLMASVGFMVCISLERYLVIAKPLWYRFRRNIKISVMVCVGIWTLPLVHVIPVHLNADFQIVETIFSIFILLPFPLFIFFLVATLKALSAACRVPVDEKRRIVAILVAVLIIYTLLFLPAVIGTFVNIAQNSKIFHDMVRLCFDLSPLADLILYLFIRKGFIDKLLASLCWIISTNQQTTSTDNETVPALCIEAV